MTVRVSIPGREVVHLVYCHTHANMDDNGLLLLALCKLDRQPGTQPRAITPDTVSINRLVQNRHTGWLARIVTIGEETVSVRTQGGVLFGFLKAELFQAYQLPGAIEEPTP